MKIADLDRPSLHEVIIDYGVDGHGELSCVFTGRAKFRSIGKRNLPGFDNHVGAKEQSLYALLLIPDGSFMLGTQDLIDRRRCVHIAHSAIDHVYGKIPKWLNRRRALLDRLVPGELVRLKGKVLLLRGTWSKEYFHFVTETLGKVWITENHVPLREFDHIVLDELVPRYVIEWLALAGLDCSRLKRYPSDIAWVADELYVPTHLHPPGHVSVEMKNYLKSFARSAAVKAADAPLISNIYISRRGTRKVLDEKAVLGETLEKARYQIVFLEDYSVAQQIKIFSQARSIVGPHGAGMTGIVFSEARLLEFVGDKYSNPCFAELSIGLPIDYHYYVASEIDGDLVVNESDLGEFFD
jgi:hypothetical protein